MSLNLGIIASSKASTPSGSLLLDTYTGAAAAYSLRKLRTAYSGSAIRVRRSNDNAQSDIGFNVSNGLDTTALTAFVGSNTGYITTWYDQSGNARDVTQATALNQPYIISLGTLQTVNSKPIIRFVSNDKTRLTRAGILSGAGQRTQIAVYKPTVGSTVNGIFGQGFDAGAGKWSYIQARSGGASGDPYFAGYAADLGNGLTTLNSNLKIGSFSYNGTTGYLWKNNTQVTSGSLTLNTDSAQVLQVGNDGGGTGTSFESLDGYIFECILYTSNQLANISGINSNINLYYTIY